MQKKTALPPFHLNKIGYFLIFHFIVANYTCVSRIQIAEQARIVQILIISGFTIHQGKWAIFHMDDLIKVIGIVKLLLYSQGVHEVNGKVIRRDKDFSSPFYKAQQFSSYLFSFVKSIDDIN